MVVRNIHASMAEWIFKRDLRKTLASHLRVDHETRENLSISSEEVHLASSKSQGISRFDVKRCIDFFQRLLG